MQLKIYFIWNTPCISWQSIHRRYGTSFYSNAVNTRRDEIQSRATGEELINLLAIPIDRKSPDYKEKRAFPSGGTETLDSFPRARKGNPADAVATMHRSITSGWPFRKGARCRGGLYVRANATDETRPFCFLHRIYVNPFARSPG